MRELPSIEELRERFSYNPETGEIRYRIDVGNVKAGTLAGTIDNHGHRQIKFRGRHYKAHRIAWAMYHGEWPPDDMDVDHKEKPAHDNRIDNLRLGTRSQNMANTKRLARNRSGYKGVTRDKQGKRWCARLTLHGKNLYLGTFDTKKEAHQAYVTAANDLFGEFANAG